MKALFNKLLGNRHDREAKKLSPLIDEINEIFAALSSLTDEELKAKTESFRERIRASTEEPRAHGDALREEKRHSQDASERESLSLRISDLEAQELEAVEDALDEVLPEAFAVVKETCRRLVGSEITVTGQELTWDMIPYDVQLLGGIALHRGKVAEMQTGEGKTLAATMPLYLNALAGRGAHLVTVNSYLAQRDAEWMGTVFRFLGLSVDVIDLYQPGTPERRQAYAADITYGTNNEFGFDYLRDNMVPTLDHRVQRPHYYAIIDEVDSILIDEARTPLIISGPVGRDTSTPFRQYNPLVADLYRKQTRIVNDLVADAERLLESDDEYSAGEKLLAAKRGQPKQRRLIKLFSDNPSVAKLVQKVEADYMREKRLHEVDEMLFYAMDEKGHSVGLSDRGVDEMSPNDPDAFVVPDLSEAMGEVEDDEELSVDEKRDRRAALEAEYAEKSQKVHVIHQLLKAYTLFQKDERYIIGEDGSIVIVDEFTGRQMAGRRWSDGLHQAVEAKEGVEIRGETQTLATITIQNYFRMYDKLSGMTGTAETEENEFHQIYGLDVMVIPTNRPVVRDDRNDLVFRTQREKFNAIQDELERLHALELPVLVGTTNVDVSEKLARMLKRRGLPHNVLNAKHHKRESEIVIQAGQPGAITIATNMAGRGTDIKLGEGVTDPRTVRWVKERGLELEKVLPIDPVKAQKVLKLVGEDLDQADPDVVIDDGGLHIIGSERHESRRIDRQLRGRAGRQGDPGNSQFFLSIEDDLMRMFMSDRVTSVMEKLGHEEGEVITATLVTKSIGRAQTRVEGNNFEARKRLLDYDDVMNQQREVVYDLRLFALEGGEGLKGEIWEMVEPTVRATVEEELAEVDEEGEWDLAGLRRRLLLDHFVLVETLPNSPEEETSLEDDEEVTDAVLTATREHFNRKLESFGPYAEQVSSQIMLSVIDSKWKDHLYDLDHLKASISYRSWGQKDPLVEYKKEAYEMFVDLMKDLRSSLTSLFFRAQIGAPPPRTSTGASNAALQYSGPQGQPQGVRAAARPAGPGQPRVDATGIASRARAGIDVAGAGALGTAAPDPRTLQTNRGEAEVTRTPVTAEKGPGRNDPCPCGSGKKYKKCHGRGA